MAAFFYSRPFIQMQIDKLLSFGIDGKYLPQIVLPAHFPLLYVGINHRVGRFAYPAAQGNF